MCHDPLGLFLDLGLTPFEGRQNGLGLLPHGAGFVQLGPDAGGALVQDADEQAGNPEVEQNTDEEQERQEDDEIGIAQREERPCRGKCRQGQDDEQRRQFPGIMSALHILGDCRIDVGLVRVSAEDVHQGSGRVLATSRTFRIASSRMVAISFSDSAVWAAILASASAIAASMSVWISSRAFCAIRWASDRASARALS